MFGNGLWLLLRRLGSLFDRCLGHLVALANPRGRGYRAPDGCRDQYPRGGSTDGMAGYGSTPSIFSDRCEMGVGRWDEREFLWSHSNCLVKSRTNNGSRFLGVDRNSRACFFIHHDILESLF